MGLVWHGLCPLLSRTYQIQEYSSLRYVSSTQSIAILASEQPRTWQLEIPIQNSHDSC